MKIIKVKREETIRFENENSFKSITDKKYGMQNIVDGEECLIDISSFDFHSKIWILFRGKEREINYMDAKNYNIITIFPKLFNEYDVRTELGIIQHYYNLYIKEGKIKQETANRIRECNLF